MTHIIARKQRFTFKSNSFYFSKTGSLFLGKVLLYSDLVVSNFEDVIGFLKDVLLWNKQFNWLPKILLKLLNLLIFFLEQENLFLLVGVKLIVLLVVIAFQLKDTLFQQLDLAALSLVSMEFKSVIEDVVNVGALKSGLKVLEFLF